MLRTRLRRTTNAQQKQRLHLLVLIAEGRAITGREAAEHLAVHRNTVGRWLDTYRQGGLEALLQIDVGGAPVGQRTLSPEAFAALQLRLAQPEGFGSYGEIQQWLAQHWGEVISYSAVQRLVHRQLKAKLKRPRPVHPKKAWPTNSPFHNACPAPFPP
jgi:transposase